MTALSSPTRLNTSSNQVMFKTFLQSHISQLSRLRTSSFLKLLNSAPCRRVFQMTVFKILLFRQRLNAFVGRSFLLVNAFFARAILDLISFLQCPKVQLNCYSQSCSPFSASFQTFYLTVRVYLNTQKYGLFCSLFLT